MMMTVAEMSRLTGVSVRTLHHYDSIGLLKPDQVTEAGYRLYGDDALRRLRSILLLREVQFPLREIKAILDRPGYDARAALPEQIRLLEMQRDRLDNIITLAREISEKGVDTMNFTPFDHSDIDRYADEAKQRWGNTAAWAEYEKKPRQNHAAAGDGLMRILADIGAVKHLSPSDEAVQQKIARLQKHITDNFYPCTAEILAGLGEMYVADERFRKNIDKAGGEGTAEFVRNAIRVYTQK